METKDLSTPLGPVVFFAVEEGAAISRSREIIERLFCRKPGTFTPYSTRATPVGHFIFITPGDLSDTRETRYRIFGLTLSASSAYLMKSSAPKELRYMYYDPDLCFRADDLFLYARGTLSFNEVRSARDYWNRNQNNLAVKP